MTHNHEWELVTNSLDYEGFRIKEFQFPTSHLTAEPNPYWSNVDAGTKPIKIQCSECHVQLDSLMEWESVELEGGEPYDNPAIAKKVKVLEGEQLDNNRIQWMADRLKETSHLWEEYDSREDQLGWELASNLFDLAHGSDEDAYPNPFTTQSPTILDIAIARGAKEDDNGGINGAEFERVGLPLMGGCQVCNATIAAYNSYPGTNGFLVGSCCVEGIEVFETVDAFETWVKEDTL